MLIKELTEVPGIAGQEGQVRELIKEQLKEQDLALSGDAMGNFYARWEGGQTPLLMLASHMDEVGFMVMGYENSGLIKFAPVGGIDLRVVPGKKVYLGDKKTPGVIGVKPIHMQKKAEQNRPFSRQDLLIDIGASSEDEARKKVNIGDQITFSTTTEFISERVMKGKAFDDRAGCTAIIEILKSRPPVKLCGAFTVQEEVGLRGAGVAASNVGPALALVLEGTTASDVPESPPHRYSTTMGEGPALTIMDRSFLANQKLNQRVMELAEREGIKYQLRRTSIGGTDSGPIHLREEGIPTIGLSLPCRYIHSPASLLNMDDLQNMIDLVKTILQDIAEGGFPIGTTY